MTTPHLLAKVFLRCIAMEYKQAVMHGPTILIKIP
jgi:hypothetical protein